MLSEVCVEELLNDQSIEPCIGERIRQYALSLKKARVSEHQRCLTSVTQEPVTGEHGIELCFGCGPLSSQIQVGHLLLPPSTKRREFNDRQIRPWKRLLPPLLPLQRP